MGSCYGWMTLASHMGEYFGETGFDAMGLREVYGNTNLLLESSI